MTDTGTVNAGRAGLYGTRRRFAMVLRRFPWIAVTIQRLYQIVQPRFTIGAVGVLLDASGDHVFLVEHVFHAVHPWGLPGGWLDRREDPADGVAREFREETGLRVRAVRPLLIQRATGMPHHMDVAYLCALDGEPQAVTLCGELLAARWVPWDAIPPMIEFQALALRTAAEQAGNHYE
ncbi:MAG TPA: NUDIX hydrolase [Aggregatilinea sp.]|uniref:NUDIX hydrolase n=1 Tax=Aggregatilinea sp. TaxID=2806333 RepID=UPI002BBE3065|nr:NUDIX hydrolase [Aggregatilinea sp.]HML22238.1 NUDIX hydrolase [Aggregatilinea sp.]